MRRLFFLLSLVIGMATPLALGQTAPTADSVMTLGALLREARGRNPELRVAQAQAEAAEARVGQAGTLADPQLTYMREGMPNFQWDIPMYDRIELMQMVMFPTKLVTGRAVARAAAGRTHAASDEKTLDVMTNIKTAFAELWYLQQSILLNRENAALLQQFSALARTKYGVGTASQPDVLRAITEIARVDNDLLTLRQRELSMKAMLAALLNRAPGDTLGTAALPDSLTSLPSLAELTDLAQQTRPMIRMDSLMVEENSAMLSMAKQEYLPDLTFGLEYMRSPSDMAPFSGWSVTVGVSIPFAPWTLGKVASRVEEAEAASRQAVASLEATRNMVRSSVNDLYYQADAKRRQLASFASTLLPAARQSLQASMTAYQTGTTDFLMLIDTYRTLVMVNMDALMARMEYEQALARLEQSAGVDRLSTRINERRDGQ